MGELPRRISRRSLVLSGLAAGRLLAVGAKGATFESEMRRYADPTTDFEVYRLTDPSYSSTLPAYYGRAISRNSGSLLFACDRSGEPQAYRMDLKTGETRELTAAEGLDASSLTFTTDNRSFCYFAKDSLFLTSLTTLKEREVYSVPEGWERSGFEAGPDGTHAVFGERRADASRLRMVLLTNGAARTVVEAPFAMSDPIQRPNRAQILYRQGDQALWLVNSDGKGNRQLKLADGRIGPADWSGDGRTLLYLRFPEDPKQLTEIRECTPDSNTDKLVAKTSQFVHFGFNRDTSVFVGASRNAASPTVLILLRVTRRELTLCEHKAQHPETVAPIFSPDSQRIYFQSDRDGKPAIYCMHVEKLVEKTEADSC